MRPLPWNQLLLLSLVSLNIGLIASQELVENPVEVKRLKKLDCTIKVFHRKCRGISAKRTVDLTAPHSVDVAEPHTVDLTPQITQLEDAILKSFLLSRSQNLIKHLLLEKSLQDVSYFNDAYQRHGQHRLKQDSGEIRILPFLLNSEETTAL
ncbi:unnamed protein product [Lymnaea stagnalis]|uniref:Uncharacterized protein n=1 Tax=Lymnaea stagnalis TaxID=6523 RepID=A0AAV2HAD3_LYMST